jgi:hypothetical protein
MHEYRFHVMFNNGEEVEIGVWSVSEPDAYRNLYKMVDPHGVTDARLESTTDAGK